VTKILPTEQDRAQQILKYQARIREIERALQRPPEPGEFPHWRQRLSEEQLQLEEAVADLERIDSPHLTTEESFRWDQIDHDLITHKISLISREMQPKGVNETRRVLREADKTRNLGAAVPMLIETHRRLTDEWLNLTYRAYCETWAAQGKKKSAAFVRAVFQNALVSLIAVRQAAILSDLDLKSVRTRDPRYSEAKDEIVRTLRRLQADWNDKLEIEARECEHTKRVASASSREESTEVEFWHSESYQKLRFRGKDYDLTRHRRAAEVVRAIHTAQENDEKHASIEEIRKAINHKYGGNMYDWFRGTGLWNHLVIVVAKGVYRLDIPQSGRTMQKTES
jgi:hypothetical protein